MVLRELLTKIGFKVDDAGADQAEDRVKKMSFGMKAAITGVVAGIASLGWAALEAAGDMEMLTTQFEVMLGSTEAAIGMMNELKQFAATTPFALEDLATGTQQLLSFGVAEDEVLERMRMLGDTAGGNAEKLNGLVLAYGKVQAKGKASMEEINMLTERGLPIITTLQKQLGVTEDQFFKLVSAGKIGRDAITEAFRTMTSEGGMFFEGMKKQSLTFQGLMSTLKDNLKLMAAGVGEALLPVAKEVIVTLTELVQGPLGALVSALLGSLAPVIKIISQLLTNVIKAIMPLTRIFEALMPIITTLLSVLKAVSPVLDLVSFLLVKIAEIIEILSPPLNDILTIVVDLINVLVKLISLELIALLDPFLDIIKDLAGILSSVLSLLIPLFKLSSKFMALNIGMQIRMMLAPLIIMGKVFAFFSGIINDIIKALSTKLLPITQKLNEVFSVIAMVVENLFIVIQWLIDQAIGKLAEFAKFLWDNLFTLIGNGINKVIEGVGFIGDKAKSIITFIAGIFNNFWGWLIGKFPGLETIINKIGSVFSGIWQGVADAFSSVWDWITGSIRKLIGWVNKIPGVNFKLPSLDKKDDGGKDGVTGGIDNEGTGVDQPPSDGSTGALIDFLSTNSPEFNPAVTTAGKTANVDMKNEININVPPGADVNEVKTAVEQAAKTVFAVELKKVLVDAGY